MEVGNSKRYNCSKCSFETDYIVHLKNHLCSKKCEKGSVKSDSKEWLAQRTCHQNTSSANTSYQMMKKTGKFSCSDCGYSCRSFGLLKLHKNIHYKGLYKCSLCSFITNFENLYRMHKEKHRDIENGRQQVNNKSFYSEPDNQTFIDTSNRLEYNVTVKDENRSPIKLNDAKNDGMEIEKKINKNVYQCLLCPFKTLRIIPFGKHLNRFHGKELSVNIGKFLGEDYVKLKILNTLSPEEIVSLATDMEVSGGVIGKYDNIFAQIAVSALPSVETAINKIKNYSDFLHSKKLKTTWTNEEKLEIYWCDVFARNVLFPKMDISKRRRRALLERGVLSAQKLKNTPNTLIHSITANIKIDKSSVTKEQALAVRKQVEDYVKSKVNSTDKRDDDNTEYLFNFESNSQNKKVIRKIRKGI